ncbi:hypothetical protein AAZX31_18G132300 [Glycine max]
MLKRVVHSLGLVEHRERGSRRQNHLKGHEPPSELNSQSKDFVVRVTHAGGHQEVYRHAVPASQLMRKHPGMCVARPEVFKVPHQSVLWHEEILVPGHRYILISFRHVEKLKRKLLEEEKNKEDKVNTEETVDTNMEGSLGEGGVEESFSSARDFYVPKEKSTSTTTRPPRRKGIKGKKPFEAPLPKQRLYNRGLGWQPSLPSVKELSP